MRAPRPVSLLLTAVLAACQAEGPVVPSAHDHPVAAVREIAQADLNALRTVLRPYREVEVAKDAGWNFVIPNTNGELCFHTDAAAMGFHYAQAGLLDGTVEASLPEALIYEPRKHGKLRLVAVEYLVPFTAWSSANPPRLYGQDFTPLPAFGVYGLHVWAEKRNPDGVFAAFNPQVSCAFADE